MLLLRLPELAVLSPVLTLLVTLYIMVVRYYPAFMSERHMIPMTDIDYYCVLVMTTLITVGLSTGLAYFYPVTGISVCILQLRSYILDT